MDIQNNIVDMTIMKTHVHKNSGAMTPRGHYPVHGGA